MRKMTQIAVLAFFSALVLSITAAASNMVPLGGVQDTPSAVNAIQEQVSSMADQIREAPVTSVNIATQYAEAAVGQLGMQKVDGAVITINRETVMNAARSVLGAIDEAADALRQSLAQNDVEPFRGLSSTVTFISTEPGMITLKIDPDVQYASVDYVRVETALYSVSIKPSDLAGILEAPLIVTLEDIGEGAEPEIRVTISDPDFAGYLTLSLPTGSGDLDCMAIVEQGTGTASPGSYNPIESRMDGRIDVPGVNLLANNGKNFTDIGGQTPAVQKAIRELAALGVTNGKTATTFSPDEKITRGQFTAMIMRAIHKVDNSARANYPDVPSTAYYLNA